jgi:hypothetical protein
MMDATPAGILNVSNETRDAESTEFALRMASYIAEELRFINAAATLVVGRIEQGFKYYAASHTLVPTFGEYVKDRNDYDLVGEEGIEVIRIILRALSLEAVLALQDNINGILAERKLMINSEDGLDLIIRVGIIAPLIEA